MKAFSKSSFHTKWINSWDVLNEDLKRVVNFDESYFPTPWRSEQWVSLLKTSQRDFTLGLLTKDTEQRDLVAMVLFFHDHADRFTHLVKVLTHPQQTRLGHATYLFKEFIKKEGACFERIYLEVECSNYAACRLYRNWGFTQLRILKDFYGQSRDGLGMLWLGDRNS